MMDGASVFILIGVIVDIVGYLALSYEYIKSLIGRGQPIDTPFLVFLVLSVLMKILSEMVGLLGIENNPNLKSEYAPTFITDTIEAFVAWLTLVFASIIVYRQQKSTSSSSEATIERHWPWVSAMLLPILWIALASTAAYQDSWSNTVYGAFCLVLGITSMGFAVVSTKTNVASISTIQAFFFVSVLAASVFEFVGNAWTLGVGKTTSYDEAVWWMRTARTFVTIFLAVIVVFFVKDKLRIQTSS